MATEITRFADQLPSVRITMRPTYPVFSGTPVPPNATAGYSVNAHPQSTTPLQSVPITTQAIIAPLSVSKTTRTIFPAHSDISTRQKTTLRASVSAIPFTDFHPQLVSITRWTTNRSAPAIIIRLTWMRSPSATATPPPGGPSSLVKVTTAAHSEAHMLPSSATTTSRPVTRKP